MDFMLLEILGKKPMLGFFGLHKIDIHRITHACLRLALSRRA